MNRTSVILILLISLFYTSCSKDGLFITNDIGSTLEESGKYRLSTFSLKKGVWDMEDTVSFITIKLQSHTNSSVLEFDASVNHKTVNPTYSIYIPKDETIPNSDYDLTAYLKDGRSLGTALEVSFKDEMLYFVLSSSIQYSSLSGTGTKEDPYIISSKDDFSSFEYTLCKRDTIAHGAGLYFKQTASFDAPPRSDTHDGRYYAGYPFAGIYDGGNNTIRLSYIGNKDEADCNIGLFDMLEEGAQISNLTIEPRIQGIKQNGGALAGASYGTVILTNIKIDGSFTDCGTNIGGFIGYAEGNLTANNCRIYTTISAISNVGGLVGCFNSGVLTVNDFSNLDNDYNTKMFSFTSSESAVGGICGTFTGKCNLKNITLEHTVSEQDKYLPVIYTDKDYAGGVFGYANITEEGGFAEYVNIATPVRACGFNAGGLIGAAILKNKFTLKGCSFSSYVNAGEHVGGFIGYLKSDGNLVLAESKTQALNNRVAQKDQGYLAVETEGKFAGGLFGYLYGSIKSESTSIINVNVKAVISCAGGIAGKIYNSTIEAGYFSLDKYMTVYSNDAAGGLVGTAENSTIRGTVPEEISFNPLPPAESFESNFGGNVKDGKGADTGKAIGGLVGYAVDSYLENLCFSGTVYGYYNVGGVVGYLNCVNGGGIKNCINKSNEIISSGGDNTGGVAGTIYFYSHEYNYINLVNYGTINGSNHTGGVVGGVISTNEDAQSIIKMQYLVNMGNVTGKANVGGCIGRMYVQYDGDSDNHKEILYSANYGNVKSSEYGNTGGIIGYGDSDLIAVMHCANHGDVYAESESKVGGIAGRLGHDPGGAVFHCSSNMEMSFCCNRGNIGSGHEDSHVGGLLGYQEEGDMDDDLDWMTHDCYNMGSITTEQDADNGGIIGYIDHYGEIRYCINIGTVIPHGNAIVGTHKESGIFYHHDNYYLEGTGDKWGATKSFTESEKKSEEIFDNFDFNDKWAIDSNDSMNGGYPYLRNCPFQFIYKNW